MNSQGGHSEEAAELSTGLYSFTTKYIGTFNFTILYKAVWSGACRSLKMTLGLPAATTDFCELFVGSVSFG